jgi:hypothetical protein
MAILTDPDLIEIAEDKALTLCREAAEILATLPIVSLRQAQNACAHVLIETFKTLRKEV